MNLHDSLDNQYIQFENRKIDHPICKQFYIFMTYVYLLFIKPSLCRLSASLTFILSLCLSVRFHPLSTFMLLLSAFILYSILYVTYSFLYLSLSHSLQFVCHLIFCLEPLTLYVCHLPLACLSSFPHSRFLSLAFTSPSPHSLCLSLACLYSSPHSLCLSLASLSPSPHSLCLSLTCLSLLAHFLSVTFQSVSNLSPSLLLSVAVSSKKPSVPSLTKLYLTINNISL